VAPAKCGDAPELQRLTVEKSIPVRFAAARSAFAKSAPETFASARLAPTSFALLKQTFVRFAPLKFVPLRVAMQKPAFRRFAPLKFARLRSDPIAISPKRSHPERFEPTVRGPAQFGTAAVAVVVLVARAEVDELDGLETSSRAAVLDAPHDENKTVKTAHETNPTIRFIPLRLKNIYDEFCPELLKQHY
jgi:hypothetical protein